MFENILAVFGTLVGFSAFVSMLVGVLKFFGVVKDDTSAKWVAGFNLVGVLALYGLKLFQPDYPVGGIDSILAEIAVVGAYIMSFVVMIFGSKFTYSALRGLPVIGKSFSE